MAVSPEVIKRLIALEAQEQGVDPRLALAVATQESSLNPTRVGDHGKSLGLFQLQRAAAMDAGIDPDRRGEPALNITGGVRYLKQKLQQSGGNVAHALSRYNRGTPTYQGIGDPRYVEHVLAKMEGGAPRQGLLQRVGRALSPASAEAAPVSPAAPPTDQAAMRRRLEMIERLEAIQRQEAGARPPAPAAPSPAPAPATPPTAASQVGLLAQQEQGRLQAERAVGSPSVPAPTPAQLARTAAATGINIAGSVGGAAAGTAIGGPVGTVIGEMLGSYGARRANVALGLEEPGMVGDIASVAVPPVLRGVGKVAPAVTKAVVKRLPGAATALHQEVYERLTAMSGRLQPPIPADDLYQQVALHNAPIATAHLGTQAATILREELALQPALRNPRLVRVAKDLATLTKNGTQDLPMQDLYAHQQRVGELVREFRSKGGVGEGRIKQLYGAFHDDLEAAATKGVPGAQDLKDAIAASRKEHMAAELDDLFQPGKAGITLDPEGRASINGGRLASAWKAKLRRDKVFRDTLSAQDKAEVEEILTLAQRLERLSVPKGGQRGSGRAAVGAAVGSAIGGPAGAAFAVYAPEMIGKAMQTPAGRAMVKRALQEGQGALDTTAINALAQLVRQQMHEPALPAGP